MVQGLRLCTSNAGSESSIPFWETKIPHAVKCGQKIFFKKRIPTIQGDRISSSLLQIVIQPHWALNHSFTGACGHSVIYRGFLLVASPTVAFRVLSADTTITGKKPSRQVLFRYNERVSRCSGGTYRIGLGQHKLESPRHPPVSVYGLLITWVWARESLIAS